MIEVNPTKFLDAEIIRHKSSIKIKDCTKLKKFPVHWCSKIPFKYKHKAITGELLWANKIPSNFNNDSKRIKLKSLQARFPINVINGIIYRFNQEKDDVLITQWWFEERKECLLRLSLALANKKFVKSFINKFEIFSYYKVRFNIVWNTMKIKPLFNIKTKYVIQLCNI